MKTACLLAAAVLFVAVPALALDATVSGTELTVTYTEPTTNADGSPLTDLARTNVIWKFLPAGTDTKEANVAATKLTGGGAITTKLIVPVEAGQERTVEITATATDTSGNESVRATAVQKRIDRLAPGAPH
jgi:hypothetical protein